MAHLEKFKQSQISQLLRHNLRETKEDGTHYNHSNKDIDIELSHLNTNLLSRGLSLAEMSRHGTDARQRYERRLNELYIYGKNRDDLVHMCSCVVTLPTDVHDDDMIKFFEICNKFLIERYGEQNAVASCVHVDETRPHLHFMFVPAIYDEKKKREKLCCKKVLTQKEMQMFHPDLQRYVDAELGYHCSILTNDNERKKNLSIAELKAQTRERVKSLAVQIEEAQEQIKQLELQESEDILYEKKQDDYLRYNRLLEKKAIIDVNEKNKELLLENEKLSSENDDFRSQNIALNDKIKKQDETINVLNSVFNTNVNLLVEDIQKVAGLGNTALMIRNAAAQLIEVVHTAFYHYARAGQIR